MTESLDDLFDDDPLTDKTKPYAAIAKIDPSRWYWVYWPTFGSYMKGKDPSRQGTEDSRNAAIEKCGGVGNFTELDGLFHQEGDPLRLNACVARRWRKVFTARKRKPNLKAAPSAQVTEYVYHHESYCSDYDASSSQYTCSHRILKKTAKCVFISTAPCRENSEQTSIRLDRKRLEREDPIFQRNGYHFNGGPFGGSMCGVFFTLDPEPPWSSEDANVPACLTALGLKCPCTEKQIRRAFRKLSMKDHPDHGGNSEDFRKLVDSYEQAIRFLKTLSR